MLTRIKKGIFYESRNDSSIVKTLASEAIYKASLLFEWRIIRPFLGNYKSIIKNAANTRFSKHWLFYINFHLFKKNFLLRWVPSMKQALILALSVCCWIFAYSNVSNKRTVFRLITVHGDKLSKNNKRTGRKSSSIGIQVSFFSDDNMLNANSH